MMRRLIVFLSATVLSICSLPATECSPEEWGVPHVSAAHVRTEPRHGAEMSTQALMGWPVRILERTPDGWSYVELTDGYRGYIIDNSLTFMSADDVDDWKEDNDALLIAVNSFPIMIADSAGNTVGDLVQGDIVKKINGDSTFTFVEFPDGRTARLETTMCMPLGEWKNKSADPARILDTAMQLMGVPYLWGGLTGKGMDCSGLTRLAYLAEGMVLPRDASQQAEIGLQVEPEMIALADLIFFASETTGRINHVALYAGDDMMIESAGRVRLSPVPWDKVATIRRVILQ